MPRRLAKIYTVPVCVQIGPRLQKAQPLAAASLPRENVRNGRKADVAERRKRRSVTLLTRAAAQLPSEYSSAGGSHDQASRRVYNAAVREHLPSRGPEQGGEKRSRQCTNENQDAPHVAKLNDIAPASNSSKADVRGMSVAGGKRTFRRRQIIRPACCSRIRNEWKEDIAAYTFSGMDRTPEAILEEVLSSIQRLSGRRLADGADKLVGAEHGLTGSDSILLLQALEEVYGIDLRPFADARSVKKKGWFLTHKLWGDATARELADYIAAQAP